MNEWKCTIKTPSNYLQTVRVEAYTHSDAVAFAESMTGGKCITAVIDNSYSSDDDDISSSGSGEINSGGLLFLAALVFIVLAWKYLLLFGALALIIWVVLKSLKE